MSRTLNGAARGSSRVVEIDPMAMKKVWSTQWPAPRVS